MHSLSVKCQLIERFYRKNYTNLCNKSCCLMTRFESSLMVLQLELLWVDSYFTIFVYNFATCDIVFYITLRLYDLSFDILLTNHGQALAMRVTLAGSNFVSCNGIGSSKILCVNVHLQKFLECKILWSRFLFILELGALKSKMWYFWQYLQLAGF